MRWMPMCGMALGLAAAAPLAAQEEQPAPDYQDQGVAEAIAEFLKADGSVQWWLDNAYGYAVFPSVGKGAIGVGGARGSGKVYEQGKLVGSTNLTQLTVGFQLGGQAFREIIFFKDKAALDNFKRGEFELAAQASAVAVTAGASADIGYSKGVAIITMAKGGLMYEASVGGQKFDYKPITSPPPS